MRGRTYVVGALLLQVACGGSADPAVEAPSRHEPARAAPAAGVCPARFDPPADEQPNCAVGGLPTCTYEEGTCYCGSVWCGGAHPTYAQPDRWICVRSCPAGGACAPEGAVCSAGECGERRSTCRDGRWTAPPASDLPPPLPP